MKTILEVLTLTTDFLSKKGIQNARRQAEDLMSDALDLKRIDLYTNFERPLTELELEVCRNYLSRRVKGEPLQYIKGIVDFYDCKIRVNQDVLIPRQETEILVDKIISRLTKDQQELGSLKGKVLFDVCTGSGCIGISIKKKFPDLKVILSDISLKALEIARMNAELNDVEVECLLGDLLQPFEGRKCDYFVSNPPYIAEKDYKNLEIEVRGFEPKSALVGGVTGYEFYKKLRDLLPGFLKNSAALFFEIGTGQGSELLSCFSGSPWKNSFVEQDYSSHDRFFFLEIE